MERFWSKVNKTEDCWIFIASGNKWGYGQFWYQGKFIAAHRFSYLLEYGSIPDNHEVHHTCRNRRCVKPEHLQPLTRQQHNKEYRDLTNSIEATKIRYRSRTHCIKGHELTEKNTRVYTNRRGYIEKRCRTCHRDREALKRKG